MSANSPQPAPAFPALQLEPAKSWKVWLAIVVLTLLWHLSVLLPKIDWAPPMPARPIQVNTVDPKKLEAIRRQWKNQEKQLLINPNEAAPKEDAEAPEDARFMSDRNRRVERETRARNQVTVPKPGRPQPEPPGSKAERAQPRPRDLPNLSQLGLPWKLTPPSREEQARRERNRAGRSYAEPEGGSQYLRDQSIPEGAEHMLNTQESVYYSFYSRLYQSIAPLWQSHIRSVPYRRRVQEGEYTTVVDVVLDGEGRLLEVRQMQGSGIDEFDQAVQEAWRKMSNFPNPPAGLLDERGEVHTGWTFTVVVNQGFNLDSRPPERNY